MPVIMYSKNGKIIMKVNKARNSFFLLITALIWGIAFVAQSEGGKAVGPYTFNCIRSFIGGLVLIPIVFFVEKSKENSKRNRKISDENIQKDRRTLITGGILCGIMLFLASTTQQLGMYYGVTAGKAGFLTACYILIVPVIGIFMKKKCGWNVWIGVVLTLVGLYLLCVNGEFEIRLCDILMIICALLFAVHILVIDKFSPLVSGVKMSCIQFFVCGILGLIPMFIIDMEHSVSGVRNTFMLLQTAQAWVTILYAGILSCGVAYTLQIIGQKGLNPTVASLIMSLESVFSVLAGWVILGEKLQIKEVVGCILIFAAIIMAQIPVHNKEKV